MSNHDYLDAIESLLQDEQEWHDNPKDVWGLPTGFECFDVGLGGLHGGELTILGARPAHGKTTLANQMAYNIAQDLRKETRRTGEHQGNVLLFSPEMTMKSLIMREACAITAVSSRDLKTGRATQGEREIWWRAVKKLENLYDHIYISAGRVTRMEDIERIVAQFDTDARFVVVDYITQLTLEGQGNSYKEVGNNGLRLKRIAMDYNIPVMVLSQLSRSVEKDASGDEVERLPKVSDISESGRLEQTADVIQLLSRKKQTVNQGDYGVPANIQIAKNRDGPTGFITMTFNTRYNRFEDIGVKRGLELEGM